MSGQKLAGSSRRGTRYLLPVLLVGLSAVLLFLALRHPEREAASESAISVEHEVAPRPFTSRYLRPGDDDPVYWPRSADGKERLWPGQETVTFTVDPASPLRLMEVRVGNVYSSPRTKAVLGGEVKEVRCTVPLTGPKTLLPEGQFAVTATVPGTKPVDSLVFVEDRKPCKLDISVSRVAGSEDRYCATVTFLDNRGRLVDFNHQAHWQGYDGPSVTVIHPNGAPAKALSVLVPETMAGVPRMKVGYDFVVLHGRSKFIFPYSGPGTYRIKAESRANDFLWDWGNTLKEFGGTLEIELPIPPADTKYDFISVYMVSERDGWALTEEAVLVTRDGGNSWQPVTPPWVARPLALIGQAAFLDSDTALVTRSEPEVSGVTVWRTTDAGRSWSCSQVEHSWGVPGAVLSIAMVDRSNGWLGLTLASAGGQTVWDYVTKDGGITWAATEGSQATHGPKTGLSAANAAVAFMAGREYSGRRINLNVTRDAGKTWTLADIPVPEGYGAAGGAETMPPSFTSDNVGFLPAVFPSDCIFYITRDGGVTWTPTSPIAVNPRPPAVSAKLKWTFPDEKHGYAVIDGKLHGTRDGGLTWQVVSSDRWLQDIQCVQFLNSEVGWAVAGGDLLKTLDGGRTWEKVQ